MIVRYGCSFAMGMVVWFGQLYPGRWWSALIQILLLAILLGVAEEIGAHGPHPHCLVEGR